MRNEDFKKFSDAWILAYEISANSKIPSDDAINHIFDTFENYSTDAVLDALSTHTKTCRFAPTVCDIKEQLDGTDPTPEEIIAMARLANTPLGILARIHIGKFDLNNQDSYYLRQRAEEVLLKLDDFKRKCVDGDYSKHELSVMKKYSVDARQPLAKGLPGPGVDAIKKITWLSGDAKVISGRQESMYLPANLTVIGDK